MAKQVVVAGLAVIGLWVVRVYLVRPYAPDPDAARPGPQTVEMYEKWTRALPRR